MSWDHKLFQRFLETRRFGRELVYLEEVDSTNLFLIKRYKEFPLVGSVVVAGHQTQGKGRQNRNWYDTEGKSLLFSILLKVPIRNRASGFLSLLPAMAIAESLRQNLQVSGSVTVKWPNDVMVNQRKLAGVLGQNILEGNTNTAVVGVGLNMNQREDNFPEEIKNIASSVFCETGKEESLELMLAQILNKWEPYFDLLIDGDSDQLRNIYTVYSMPIGLELTRSENGHTVLGVYQGIGKNGQLLLRDQSGLIKEFYTGDLAL